jgi:hypothetical protein
MLIAPASPNRGRTSNGMFVAYSLGKARPSAKARHEL